MPPRTVHNLLALAVIPASGWPRLLFGTRRVRHGPARAGEPVCAVRTAGPDPAGCQAALDLVDGFGAYSVESSPERGPGMASVTVTRVAHSTVLLNFDGAVVLTDPWFSERAMYHRGEPLAVDVADLPPLTGVLVSHGHYDHCDLAAFAAYPDKAVPFMVKRGLGGRVRAAGFRNVTEVDAWQSASLGPVRVTAAPAKHGVPEVTFVLQGAGRDVFFGADTLRIPELDEIADRFPDLDLALLPVNGLAIRPALNKQVVMNAAQAADLTRVLHPRLAVPIHYAFTSGPIGDRLFLKLQRRPELYRDATAETAPDTTVHILRPGQSLDL